MNPTTNAAERAVQAFSQANGRPPTTVVRAPGRVNLIGEHTDYNDGFVLPLALPYGTAIAMEPIDEPVIEATSDGFGTKRIELSAAIDPDSDWAVYLHGMAKLLAADGFAVGGWRGTLATDIPAGAGLSSSAALEVAAGLAALVSGGRVDPGGGRPALDLLATIASIGTRVENEVLGLPSGIMDQLISATAAEGSALLVDCATATGEAVPVPDEALVVVLDTGTRRQLVDSEFAARRADCERAAARLGVNSLRQAEPAAA
ncbi:MAG: galactokinase family protein, partial [Actinomycetota bacterium]